MNPATKQTKQARRAYDISVLLLWAAAAATMMFNVACVPHIKPYEPKVRHYEPAAYAQDQEQRQPGSLWSDSAVALLEDARARRVGDIVTISIDERADASRDIDTKTSRQQEIKLGVSAFFTAIQKLVATNEGLDPDNLVSALSETDFQAKGSTNASGSLTATLPVRVKQRLPNGDLYLEGHKVLLLNQEETHLYISGVVRQVDISPDNTVPSSRLADVELEYTGRGTLSDSQGPGWLARTLDFLWPF